LIPFPVHLSNPRNNFALFYALTINIQYVEYLCIYLSQPVNDVKRIQVYLQCPRSFYVAIMMIRRRFINKYNTLIFCILTIIFYYDYLYTKLLITNSFDRDLSI